MNTLRGQNLDLLTWYAHEVAPRYPGLFGTGLPSHRQDVISLF